MPGHRKLSLHIGFSKSVSISKELLIALEGNFLVLHCAPPTAHNIRTSKMAAVLPTGAKRINRGRFCRAKAFIRNNNAADPGLISKNKKLKEMCVIPKSAVVFHFPAIALWNY